MGFKPATKEKSKLRMALLGPSGCGKTFTALKFATALGKKIAVIDSERGSASKYADLYSFDVCDLETHSPQEYVKRIKEAEAAGYEVLVIDSLSHAWNGKDGALEQVDKVTKRSQSGNSFGAWREVTPQHNALVDAMLQSKCHIIATMRVKMDYILEENEKGRKAPKKVGLAPIQRDGVEYEFDVIADMNLEHDLIVSKTRCHLVDGAVVNKPGAEFAETLKGWLDNGSTPKPSAGSNSSTGSAPTASDKTATTTNNVGAATGAAAPAGKPDPKQPQPAPTAAQNTATAAGNAGSSTTSTPTPAPTAEPLKKEDLDILLTAGELNGWDKKEISKFVCYAFKVPTPKEIATKVTKKQIDIATRLISMPQNAGNKVTVALDGNPASAAQAWPQAS